jgi:hypothetical protein
MPHREGHQPAVFGQPELPILLNGRQVGGEACADPRRGGLTMKRMMILALVVLLGMSWTTADAYWRGGIYVGPGWYRPYPYRVYVAPVVVVAPPPVVVAPVPQPVYVVQPAPQPVYVPHAPVATQPGNQPQAPAPSGYQTLPPQPVPVQ